jgi:carboxyl-terminal processing protease
MPIKDIQTLIKGPVNTEVEVTVKREGVSKPITFNLIRHEVTIKNVTYVHLTKENIGYVDIQRFSVKAADELEDAINMLKDSAKVKKQPLKGLVLDLRDDPGGLLKVAVSVASKFLDKGSTIVTTAGRDSSKMRTYVSSEKPQLRKTPLVVLINERSASASEIVAGAIQDLDRGVIVGTSSFGKGLVQTITQLPYNTKLKITTAKYFTPSGRLIQKVDYFKRNKSLGKRDVLSVKMDSLTKIYKTVKGRKVYGGGGIIPDVEIKEREFSELEKQLLQQSMFFKFANQFRGENPALPSDFLINKNILKSFYAYLNSENFEYQSTSQQMLEDLKSQLNNKDQKQILKKINELDQLVMDDNKKEYERQEKYILNILVQEIYMRYNRDKAREHSFEFDNQFHEAIDILTNKSRYKTLLSLASKDR